VNALKKVQHYTYVLKNESSKSIKISAIRIATAKAMSLYVVNIYQYLILPGLFNMTREKANQIKKPLTREIRRKNL
jgi:hypothetical protein